MEQLRLLDDASARPLSSDAEPLVIRESRRARRLILQLIPPYTLEVVVPKGTRPAEVEAFLAENRAWLERARTEVQARYPAALQGLPEPVELTAIGRRWRVEYLHDPTVRPRRRVYEDRLQLTLPAENHRSAWFMLRQWLMNEARQHLKSWVWREADSVGLVPKRVQIRTQRTRWGSCSGKGTISLNAALLFLEPAVARYLMIHELCHLRHLNHSARYWKLVERYEPEYRRLDRALSESWSSVPAWALKG